MSQIQLVARGDIDASLTGNPSITFFKSVYRKHTNFSMEDMVVDTIPAPFAGHKYPLRYQQVQVIYYMEQIIY